MSFGALERFEQATLVADEAEARLIDDLVGNDIRPGDVQAAINQVHTDLMADTDLLHADRFGYQIARDAWRWRDFRGAYTDYINKTGQEDDQRLSLLERLAQQEEVDRALKAGEPFLFHTYAQTEDIRRRRTSHAEPIRNFARDLPLQLEQDVQNTVIMNLLDEELTRPRALSVGDESMSGLVIGVSLPGFDYSVVRKHEHRMTRYHMAVLLSSQAAARAIGVKRGSLIGEYDIVESWKGISATAKDGPVALAAGWVTAHRIASILTSDGPYVFKRPDSTIPELDAQALA